MKFELSAAGVRSFCASDMQFRLILVFIAFGALVARADPNPNPNPVPEPDPARVIGKYLFSYNPGDGEYQLSKQPLDLTNIPNSEYFDADTAASQISEYSSSSGPSSTGHMTSYITSTRHGSFNTDSEDSDEKPTYYHRKRKPIIPILHQYSVIHTSNGNSELTNGGNNASDDDDDEEDYYENSYKPPKVIHTKAKAIPISQHIEVESPFPVPFIKKIHVPVPKGVKIKIPHPVLVPVPQPYPVHVPVSQPVAIPVIREITIPIEKIVPYPVEKKVPVPIEKPVPYPVEKHIPVHIPQPYPVKVPVVKTIVHKLKPPRTIGVGSVTF